MDFNFDGYQHGDFFKHYVLFRREGYKPEVALDLAVQGAKILGIKFN